MEKMEEIITWVERSIQKKSDREVYSNRIGELVMEKLKYLDDVAYVRFASVYRQFKDVGQFMEELKDILGKDKPARLTDKVVHRAAAGSQKKAKKKA